MKKRKLGTLLLLACVIYTLISPPRSLAVADLRPTNGDVGRSVRDGSGRRERFRSSQIIVRLAPGAKISRLNGRFGTQTLEQLPGTDYYLLQLPEGEAVADRLSRMSDEGLTAVAPNYHYQSPEVLQTSQAFIDQTSQAFIDQTSQAFIDWAAPAKFAEQKAVGNLHILEAHKLTKGSGIKVAVIDTGIDAAHPLFAGRIEYPVYDFVDDDANPAEETGAGYGHGTFVAGLVALAAPKATLMPLRAFDSDGTGTSFSIAKAIRYAVNNGARVINMSFGMLEEDSLVKDAINYAAQKAYLVAAAGNDNENFIHFPASSASKTLSVTSTGPDDIKAPFANFHKAIDVSAPGIDVYSAYPDGRWAYWSGTSFSTALATGEAVLLLSLRPNASRLEIDLLITLSGLNINSLNPKYVWQLGRSRIDYNAAVLRLLDLRVLGLN